MTNLPERSLGFTRRRLRPRFRIDRERVRTGFTLIELLVVVAIIGVLASLLLRRSPTDNLVYCNTPGAPPSYWLP